MIRRLTAAAAPAIVLGGCIAAPTHLESGSGDAGITSQVRALFDSRTALGPPNMVRVRTVDHVVYLNGEVSTDYVRDMAQAIAAGVPGVVRIVNSIGVSYAGL
jgi:osmotically-inducible protein OsmY